MSDKDDLKLLAEKAHQAVSDIKDEVLKKVAFEKILDSLLKQNQDQHITQSQIVTPSIEHHSFSDKAAGAISESLQEFFSKKNQKSHPDIILTVAYYYHFKGNQDFNVDEVNEAYSKILVPKPKNPTDIINHNIHKGFIIKVDKQKDSRQAYHITRAGIEYVKNNFTGKSKSLFAPKSQRKRKENATQS